MKFKTMQSEIMAKWSEHFNGKCNVDFIGDYPGMCGRFIWIAMKLSEKTVVCDDIFQIRFIIDLPDNFNKLEKLPKNLTITSKNFTGRNLALGYCIKPEPEKDKGLECGFRAIPFRETTGTPKKIIQVIGKFIDKLYEQFTADYKNGNITNNYIEIVKENLK